ncbi:hypothetical protein WJX72_008969 [[Myrmecia] bisecta]|uniref:Uncharacterized protein n=1 Tax=[Myrmecia] bisecta TaxID=41462 RepID=A0AAW1R840_9CHLO
MAAFRWVLAVLLAVCVPVARCQTLGADPSISRDAFSAQTIPFDGSQTINLFGTLPPFQIDLYFQPPYGQPGLVATVNAQEGFFQTTWNPATLSPKPTPAPNGFLLRITDVIGRTADSGLFGIAPAPAVGTGDPVFRNWNGEAYEFVGEDNATFNLLSTPDHNLNVHLVSANISTKENGGTLMDAFGLVLKNNTVEVSANEAGNVTVVLDGNLVITQQELQEATNHKMELDFGEDAMLVVELYQEYHGHTVHIFTPIIHLVIYPTLPGVDTYYEEYLRAHFNFDLNLQDPSVSAIHGIIGQTAPNSFVNKKRGKLLAAGGNAGTSTARFTGQGTESWYRTTSLFSHDNKLNLFGKAPRQPAVLESGVEQGDALKHSRRRLRSKNDARSPSAITASGRLHI